MDRDGGREEKGGEGPKEEGQVSVIDLPSKKSEHARDGLNSPTSDHGSVPLSYSAYMSGLQRPEEGPAPLVLHQSALALLIDRRFLLPSPSQFGHPPYILSGPPYTYTSGRR